MNLNDLHRMLSYGELSNLALSGEGSGDIDSASRPKILLYTNDALLRLYARFILKENDVLIEQYEHITFYHLVPRFAVSYIPAGIDDNESYRYIKDLTAEPFLDDVIKPLQVMDARYGLLPLNDINNVYSVFTPQAKCVQVPHPKNERMMSVSYQARHVPLLGELGEIIDLPDVLLGALTAYIAYKVYSHMNTQESSAKAQEHLMMFEKVCSEAEEKDLLGTSLSSTNSRFQRRGWI